jgi:hypothetical protein
MKIYILIAAFTAVFGGEIPQDRGYLPTQQLVASPEAAAIVIYQTGVEVATWRLYEVDPETMLVFEARIPSVKFVYANKPKPLYRK